MKTFKLGFVMTVIVAGAELSSAQSLFSPSMTTFNYGQNQMNCFNQNQNGFGQSGRTQLDSYQQEALSDLRQDYQDKGKEKKSLERELDKLHSDISDALTGEAGDFVLDHIENQRKCSEYSAQVRRVQEGEDEDEGAERPTAAFRLSKSLLKYCEPSRAGAINAAICEDSRFRAEDATKNATSKCRKALSSYKSKYDRTQKLADQMEELKDDMKETLSARNDSEDFGEDREAEGGICLDCMVNGNSYVNQRQNYQGLNNISMAANGVYGAVGANCNNLNAMNDPMSSNLMAVANQQMAALQSQLSGMNTGFQSGQNSLFSPMVANSTMQQYPNIGNGMTPNYNLGMNTNYPSSQGAVIPAPNSGMMGMNQGMGMNNPYPSSQGVVIPAPNSGMMGMNSGMPTVIPAPTSNSVYNSQMPYANAQLNFGAGINNYVPTTAPYYNNPMPMGNGPAVIPAGYSANNMSGMIGR